MPSGCSGYGTGCNTPSRANSKHSSAARKQEEGTKGTMSMFSRVGLGPFALIVLVVVLRHETWCSIVETLELGGVEAVERRVARERHQATTHDGGEAVGLKLVKRLSGRRRVIASHYLGR